MSNNSSNNKTLFVNFFGGPGIGKSRNTARLFSEIKDLGINAETISEFAKHLTWKGDKFTLGCQPYVTGKQLFKQYILMDKVEVAITDSPILLGIVYQGFGCSPAWEQSIFEQFHLFNNLNILLKRNSEAHPYNPKGRSQEEHEAKEIDNRVHELLLKNNIDFTEVEVQKDNSHINIVLDMIHVKLNK